MVSLPPQTSGQAVPPGALCFIPGWQLCMGSSAEAVCHSSVSDMVMLPSFPCRQDSPNTVVSLQSAFRTAGKTTFFFPDTGFLWLALFHASRYLLCSTAHLRVMRKLLYYVYIFTSSEGLCRSKHLYFISICGISLILVVFYFAELTNTCCPTFFV